jgi:hypothetical protein
VPGPARHRHGNPIPRLDAAGQRTHFPAHHVFQVQHRADVYGHRRPDPVEIGQLQHYLLPAGGGHDPLRQPFPHARKDIGQPGRLVPSPALIYRSQAGP